jgi:hypothetical protein
MATATSALAAPSTCPVCRGSGVLGHPPRAQACPRCNGTGQIQQQPIRVPFDLVIPNVVLTALQNGVSGQQQIDQDADFEWIETVSTQTGIYSVQLKDTSTGRFLSNASVNSLNFAGTAQLPHVLIEPYIWPRSSVVLGIFNDLSNAGNTVQLVLRGYKLYPRSNPAQGSQGAIVQS